MPGFIGFEYECKVTVNIVLSEPDAFCGGGTLFWPEEDPAEASPLQFGGSGFRV